QAVDSFVGRQYKGLGAGVTFDARLRRSGDFSAFCRFAEQYLIRRIKKRDDAAPLVNVDFETRPYQGGGLIVFLPRPLDFGRRRDDGQALDRWQLCARGKGDSNYFVRPEL